MNWNAPGAIGEIIGAVAVASFHLVEVGAGLGRPWLVGV